MAADNKNITGKPDSGQLNLRKLVCLIFLLSAFVWIILGAGDLITMDKPPESFLSIDAVVVSGDIESNSLGKKDGGSPSTVYYNAVIVYKYTVNGETYTSRRVMGQAMRNNPAPAQTIVEKHPPGSLLPIIYNPDAPAESRLDVPYMIKPALLIGAGVLCMILAILSFIYIPENRTQAVKPATKPVIPPTEKKAASPRPLSRPQHALSPEAVKLQGTWSLLYQVPSMREIIAASRASGHSAGPDTKAVMSAGIESLTVTIGPAEIEFNYRDSKTEGSCDIVSLYTCSGNRLDLEHISMDFLVADVAGFPPTSYIFDLNNAKLTLTSHGIDGLGGRSIVYIFKRVEKEG